VLDIVSQHGEWIHAGQQFIDADRSTEIEVSIAHVHKPFKELTYDFGDVDFETEHDVDDAEFSASPLAHADLLQALVDQYNAAKRVIVEMAQLRKKKRFYLSGIWGEETEDGKQRNQKTLQEELDDLKGAFWKHIFERTNLGKVTTSDFQDKFYAQLEAQKQMAFSLENIKNILGVFYTNRREIMNQCLWDVFEKATSYHEKNKIHHEGWKTNKSYKLNNKIIMPWGVSHDNGHWTVYRSRDFLLDIDRAMCLLSGKQIENITTVYQVLDVHCTALNAERWGKPYLYSYSDWVVATFFEARMFKKGTVHLKFKDKQLLDDFNYKVASEKGWKTL
jgi:hypothetical protein